MTEFPKPPEEPTLPADRPSSRNSFTRFLDGVEWLGNLLPHPVTLFPHYLQTSYSKRLSRAKRLAAEAPPLMAAFRGVNAFNDRNEGALPTDCFSQELPDSKWADFGLTGFGSGVDLADVHLRHRAECDRPYVRDCSDLRAGSKRSAGCRH